MKELNEVSFAIKLNDVVSNLKKGNIFKLVYIKGNFYIANFNDALITQIEPINLNDDAKNYLENLETNYAYIDTISKNNNFAMIVSKKIFGIKTNIEQFSIYYENEAPSVDLLDTIDNSSKGIIALIHVKDDDNDNILIESNKKNKAYVINKKIEYDSLNNNEEKNYFEFADKLKTIKRENYQRYLLVGNIGITDKKQYIPDSTKLALYYMQADVQNYLNLWNEYNRIEFEKSFIEFRNTSYIRYDQIYNENEIKVTFDDANYKKIKSFEDKLCLLGETEILNLFKTSDFEEYNKVEKDLLNKELITVVSLYEKNDKERSIKIHTNDRNYFEKSNSSIGYICLSLLGNKISYNRREKAKQRIITGRAGIQKMHTWFTDNPEPCQKQEHIEIDSNLLKNSRLTPNQKEAIDIICNTPDIAIIQGPPGTGKTTVIREAIVQLNAQKENKFDFGNNLLSGFRHETVKNLTESINLFGLPAVKIDDSIKDFSIKDQIEPEIEKFVDNLIDTLRTKYKDLTVEDDQYIEFKKKYFNYISFDNSIDSSIDILNEIKNLDIFKYDFDVSKKIDELIKSLNSQSKNASVEEKYFLDFLYSLPIDEQGVLDDKERIENEILVYEDNFKDDCKELKSAYINKPFNSVEIRKVRKKLILKHRVIPNILISKGKKEEIVNYLESLFNTIRIERTKKFGGDNVAILDYIDSLTENPYLIRETLLDYTKVLGATNQHSTSRNMFEIKDDNVMFDNVFIDEAATSSPLDLFIPMSIAKKKVILVGDHKQLPNIVDEEIVDEIEENISKKTSNAEDISSTMKKTLFEILMEKANELEKKDGIKRVITLNTQFRMNPNLGKIVSDSFYDGTVQSVREESEFIHNYHNLNGKYLYWLDTPYDKSLDRSCYRKFNSHSRQNIPEAKKIAKHIKEALDAKNYEKLSIGIITIYKDQVEAIKNELRNIGIYDNDFNLTSNYSSQEILIGTVDAFQGREFDVVYLSLVYVFSEDEKYSRLANENAMSLMCVALSRQKRLLIVVGDLSIYNIEKAKNKVKPLYDFAMKCSGGDMHE